MRVGVQLPEVEREVRWPEYVAMARAAEEVGLDSLWVGDHLLYRGDGRPERGPWDAWTLLAGLAAVTERVGLGPLVACTAFRPPGVLARTAAAVHELSGRRLVLGLGAGWNEEEFRAFGVPFDRRASRFQEAFEIVRRLLAGERVTFRGTFHEVEDAVLLPRLSDPIPLMVGSTGDRVLAATLPHVDAWNTWYDWYGNTPDGFSEGNAKIDEAIARAGREPGEVARSACVLVVVDPTSGERPGQDGGRPLTGGPEEVGAGGPPPPDEVILVLDPIDERSIRFCGAALATLPDRSAP